MRRMVGTINARNAVLATDDQARRRRIDRVNAKQPAARHGDEADASDVKFGIAQDDIFPASSLPDCGVSLSPCCVRLTAP